MLLLLLLRRRRILLVLLRLPQELNAFERTRRVVVDRVPTDGDARAAGHGGGSPRGDGRRNTTVPPWPCSQCRSTRMITTNANANDTDTTRRHSRRSHGDPGASSERLLVRGRRGGVRKLPATTTTSTTTTATTSLQVATGGLRTMVEVLLLLLLLVLVLLLLDAHLAHGVRESTDIQRCSTANTGAATNGGRGGLLLVLLVVEVVSATTSTHVGRCGCWRLTVRIVLVGRGGVQALR